MAVKQVAPSKPVPTAKPGTEDAAAKKEKKEKVERVMYPGVKLDGEGKVVEPLKEMPADFDPKKHKPLNRKMFADEGMFYEFQAGIFEARAKRLRNLAEESRKLGNNKDRAKLKRLVAMQKKFAELQESLKGQGIDVEALLAGATAAKG